MQHLLLLFIVPFIASVATFFMNVRILKFSAIALSLIPLAILIAGGNQLIGAQIQTPWIPPLSIEFFLSVDSLSLIFLYLTAIIIPLALIAAKEEVLQHPHFFYATVLFLQGLLIGFFTAQDLVLFTVLWEAMLLPLYFLISLYGKENRRAAALKFIIYMIAGSVFMVIAVLALYLNFGSFQIPLLAEKTSGDLSLEWIGIIFLIAFAVKTPLFPFHAWLPDAYYEASTPGSILLAGILSKAGIYGLLRISLGLFPHLLKTWDPYLLPLAIAGVFYAGLIAWRQEDFKRLIAYSSLAHVNFILAGLFVWNEMAHTGAILQSFNHGITIGALFLVFSWLEERVKTTSMIRLSGLAKWMPCLCWTTLFFVLASIALPGTNNFVGELLVFFGLFQKNPWFAAFLGLTVILSAMYMLRLMRKVYFGPFDSPVSHLRDIGLKQIGIAVPLIALVLWIGLYPAPILKVSEKAAPNLEERQ